VNEALNTILAAWKGTPYRPLRCSKGSGVDCIRFVVAVLNELHGRSLEVPQNVPGAGSSTFLRDAFRTFRSYRVEAPGAGDVVLLDGHVMIHDGLLCWHATRAGVVRSALPVGAKLYRPLAGDCTHG
jgi:hypothetical protein